MTEFYVKLTRKTSRREKSSLRDNLKIRTIRESTFKKRRKIEGKKNTKAEPPIAECKIFIV